MDQHKWLHEDGAKSLCDDIIKFHPEGDMHVCTKLRSNPIQ